MVVVADRCSVVVVGAVGEVAVAEQRRGTVSTDNTTTGRGSTSSRQ